jgi:glycosyltransferase involved in cell wall biosynthesis
MEHRHRVAESTPAQHGPIPEQRHDPRITIAVPSYNQGPFIRETLQSLVDQHYPNLEAIVQDGGSTDGAIEVAQEFAQRYPDTFRLYVEKDRGPAHALNMAFARSTGEILGYLNTDDTLYPGCLNHVAREIDPARGRYIVFGRCLFTGEGPYVGLEHPAEYRGHFDLLAVWRRGHNAIPQPSTFWHRSVYERCGGFDAERGLDFVQWCKFSKHFWFHKVDELWSTYRMHPASVTSNTTEQEWIELMIKYSRAHWGPWWHPLRWRCSLSYRIHRSLAGYWLLRSLLARRLRVVPHRGSRRRGASAVADKYGDNWIGPVYRAEFSVPPDATRLTLLLEHHPQGHHRRISPGLWLNGKLVDRRRASEAGRLSFAVDLVPYRGASCTLEVRTPEFFIPRFITGAPDDRQLSVLLLEQRIE